MKDFGGLSQRFHISDFREPKASLVRHYMSYIKYIVGTLKNQNYIKDYTLIFVSQTLLRSRFNPY